jgi:hypothetical protein
MIARSLLIGFIAFDGAVVAGAFSAQDTAGAGLGPVFGNRNFSGFKGAAPGFYTLRIGGPTLTSAVAPPQVPNEWSRSFGNQKVTVTLSFTGPGVLAYNLVRLNDNTWDLSTFIGGVPLDTFVAFSVETLVT